MAADYSYNFDDNTDQGWTRFADSANVSSTRTAQAALASSSYGIRVASSTNNLDPVGIDRTLPATYSDLYYQFHLRINTGSAMQYSNKYMSLIYFCVDSIWNAQAVMQLHWSGTAWSIHPLDGTGSYGLSMNTDYLIEVRFRRHSTAGGFQVWVDGTLVIDDLTHNTSGSNIGFIRQGLIAGDSNWGSSLSLDIDQIQLGSTYIGPGTSTYTVSYDANGGSGSQTDANSPYEEDTTVTVLGTGTIARTGYTFIEWNTAANGTGTAYDPDDTFSMPASNVTLYAQWQENDPTYAVTYDANGGSGSQTDASSPYTAGSTVTVLGLGSIVRPGYTFTGWNTAANGSGTAYAPAATFSMPSSAVTLYAQWSRPNTIVGHESCDASVLSNAQVTAAAALKVYFEDASTGTDIVGDSDTDTSAGRNYNNTADCGLHELYDSNNRYLCGRDHHQPGNDYTWFSTHSGLQSNRRDNPPPDTKLSGFLSLSANMRSVLNVAMFKFCWIDTWPSTEGYVSDGAAFAASLIEDIETFEAANPGLIVPYWTMPLQSDASYAARDAYNNAIRTYCAANGKWLIDMADIECHNDSGVKQVDGNGREIATSTYVAADGGHLASAGRLKMANAYWVSMARIAASLTAHTVSYNGNGSTGGSAPTDSNTYVPNATVTVLGNTGSLTRTGYVFSHWNTAANGTGTSYDADETFLMGSANVTLYAQWTAVYSVTYNSNGATGGSAPIDSSSPYAASDTVTVLGNTGSLVRTGYAFAGWNTASDGSGTGYNPDATFSMPSANMTLYAQWTASHTVTYNGNGNTEGSAPVDTDSYLPDASVDLASHGSLGRNRYTFLGWCLSADGSGTVYSETDTYTMGSANVTFYAIWTPTIYQPGDILTMPSTGLRLYAAWAAV